MTTSITPEIVADYGDEFRYAPHMAKQRRIEIIRILRGAGLSFRAVGDACGVSHVYVQQLLAEDIQP